MIQFYPVSARRLVLTCFAIAAAPECRARRPPRTGQRHLEGPAAPGRLPQDQLPRNPTATGPWQDGSGRAARLCSAVAGVSLFFLLLLAFHWFDMIEVVVVERLFSAVASVSLVWQDGSGRAERLFSAGAGVSLGFCHGHTDREQASLKAGGAAYQKVFFCAKSSVPCVQGSRAILSTGRCKFRHLLASKQCQGHPLFSRLQR